METAYLVAQKRLSGMTGFLIVWLGQVVSVLTSAMSHFALTIWMYQQTGSATAMGLMQVFFITPFLLISPIAGAMVDRYNRKLMMMISDLSAVLATFCILILQAAGHLQFWHLYVAAVINGLGNTFQWPAYSAAISTMVSKEQYGRVNGMISLVESGPGVFAPLMAGALLPFIGLTGILFLDVATFFLAIGALLIVHVPRPIQTVDGQKGRGNIWKEAFFGFKYIFARPSLLGLVSLFFAGNLFAVIGLTVFAPLILARTGNNSVIFGILQSVAGGGGVVGAVIMSAWGGPKRRIHGLLGGWIFGNLFGTALFGFGRDLTIWIPTVFVATVTTPLVSGSSQAIWQAKVAPDVQGRVFAARRLIAWFTQPIAPIISGVLADYVLEPAMMVNTSSLAHFFGRWVGSGPGAGMSLLFIFSGVMVALTAVVGYIIPFIRNIESLLPDHQQCVPVSQSEN